MRCELCKAVVEEDARLCASCAEAVNRLSEARDRIARTYEAVHEQPKVLKRKAERAQAKAEKLTPFVLG